MCLQRNSNLFFIHFAWSRAFFLFETGRWQNKKEREKKKTNEKYIGYKSKTKIGTEKN